MIKHQCTRLKEDAEMSVAGSHRHGPAGIVIGVCVSSATQDYGRLRVQWAVVTSHVRWNSPPSRVDPPLAIRDSLSHSFPFARPRLLARKTPRVSRRNMLARTSDTLGFGVCRAVPITPRRIPSACYLSLGTCAGDIMWESKRILRYTRFARQTSLQNLETKIWATNLNKSYITSKFGPLNGPLRYNFLN